jgi:hypothetical protein
MLYEVEETGEQVDYIVEEVEDISDDMTFVVNEVEEISDNMTFVVSEVEEISDNLDCDICNTVRMETDYGSIQVLPGESKSVEVAKYDEIRHVVVTLRAYTGLSTGDEIKVGAYWPGNSLGFYVAHFDDTSGNLALIRFKKGKHYNCNTNNCKATKCLGEHHYRL